LFPTTVDVLVESGALDNAIDAKVKELAMRRGLRQPPMSQEPQIDTLEALVATAQMLGTDQEVREDVEKLVRAAAGDQVVESGLQVIRRSGQFDLQNLLPRMVENRPRRRRKTKTDKNMSKALAQANKELRKKNGQLRKGVTQADVMRRAHRIRRKMS
jgi:hypothetical protein